MNAPAAVQTSVLFQDIPLDNIALSGTQMQVHRRAGFDKESLKMLAENVRQVGVLQPILVRPAGKGPSMRPYELVAGERRFIAARIAKLPAIPAMVRSLTDLEALELQVIENKQREDLHELIEAEGFEELMKKHHHTAEQIADKVGMSRRYVFNRMKLLDLCPEVRTAFLEGKVNSSVAMLLARLPVHDLQKRALKEVSEADWKGEPMSARAAAQHMQRHYMLRLAEAPFNIKDEELVAKAGACGACPKRTGNQPELFADVQGTDVCTDPRCFDTKKAAHAEQLRAAAEARGQKVIDGAQAKKIKPNQYNSSLQGGFIALDDEVYAAGKHQSYRKLLGKDAPETQLLQDPHDNTKLIEIVQRDRVVTSLRAKGVRLDAHGSQGYGSSSSSPTQKLNERKGKLETQICRALFDAIHARPIKIDHELLVQLAIFTYEIGLSYEHHEIIEPLHGLDDGDAEKIIGKMDDGQLARLLVDVMLVREIKRTSYAVQKGEAQSALLNFVAKKAAVDIPAIRKPFQEAFDEREGKRKERESKIRSNAKKKAATPKKAAADDAPKEAPAKKAKK